MFEVVWITLILFALTMVAVWEDNKELAASFVVGGAVCVAICYAIRELKR